MDGGKYLPRGAGRSFLHHHRIHDLIDHQTQKLVTKPDCDIRSIILTFCLQPSPFGTAWELSITSQMPNAQALHPAWWLCMRQTHPSSHAFPFLDFSRPVSRRDSALGRQVGSSESQSRRGTTPLMLGNWHKTLLFSSASDGGRSGGGDSGSFYSRLRCTLT